MMSDHEQNFDLPFQVSHAECPKEGPLESKGEASTQSAIMPQKEGIQNILKVKPTLLVSFTNGAYKKIKPPYIWKHSTWIHFTNPVTGLTVPLNTANVNYIEEQENYD